MPSPLLVNGDGMRLGGVPETYRDGRFEDSCRPGRRTRPGEGEAAEQGDRSTNAEERVQSRQEPDGHDQGRQGGSWGNFVCSRSPGEEASCT